MDTLLHMPCPAPGPPKPAGDVPPTSDPPARTDLGLREALWVDLLRQTRLVMARGQDQVREAVDATGPA